MLFRDSYSGREVLVSKGFKLYSVSTATSLKSQAIFFSRSINHVNCHSEGPVNIHRLEGEGCDRIKYSRSPGSPKALQYSMTLPPSLIGS